MQSILILEPYRYTLSVSRALKASGYSVILGVSDVDLERSFINRSNSIDSIWHHTNAINNTEEFKDALVEKLASDSDIVAIYPCGENMLETLLSFSQNGIITAGSNNVTIISPQQDVVSSCLDKPTSIELAQSCGIPVPSSTLVKNKREIERFVNRNQLPIALKSINSNELVHDEKCFFIEQPEQLEEFVFPENLTSLLVQQKISGKRHNCMFVASQGKLVRYFESEVLRTTEVNDTGYSILDKSVKAIEKHVTWCENFVNKTNYNGIGCIQFLYDENNQSSMFLEVNPRTDATIALAQYCGASLIESAVKVSLNQPTTPSFEYKVNKKRYWIFGDITSLVDYKNHPSVGVIKLIKRLFSILYHLILADCHATWSLEDPKPTLTLFAKRIVSKILKILNLP